MAQIGIVRQGFEFFREYKIESGDTLSSICIRFGQDRDTVYYHPVNAAFRALFPDPDQIDIYAGSLFIPLPGAPYGGVSRPGSPIKDFIFASLKDDAGKPLSKTELLLIKPKNQKGERDTDAAGDIIVFNPKPGDWYLSSTEFMLLSVADASKSIPPLELTGNLPKPTVDFKLERGLINNIVARRVFYIICPMCGMAFRTVKKPVTGPDNQCPKDGFNLTTLEGKIEAERISFTNPKTGQNPKTNPTGLKCRGIKEELETAHGKVTVLWDESRFVDPNGDDYTLWGKTPSGPPTVTVIGRKTWGAGSPNVTDPDEFERPRVYDFHATKQGASQECSAYLLFTWDDIPISASSNIPQRLKDFLKQNFDAIWVDSANIQKSTDEKTIIISTASDSLSIELDDVPANAAKSTVKAGSKTYELIVRKENRKLNIYANKGNEMYTSAIPSNETTPLSKVLRWITIHHGGFWIRPQNSYNTAKEFQKVHRDTKGVEKEGRAADIGYHFIIDANGAIYEGRPLGIKGSHVGCFNGGNVGIVLAGDFEDALMDDPTKDALDALKNLVYVLTWRFGIRSVWGHKERKMQVKNMDTACPGKRLIPNVNMLNGEFPGPPP